MSWTYRIVACGFVAVAAGLMIFLFLGTRGADEAPAAKAHKAQPVGPPLQPEYAKYFQTVIDYSRPPSYKHRLIVKDCRRGRYGNEHVCAWVNYRGECFLGFIVEDPGNGTVPAEVGRVPLTAAKCNSANALNLFFKRKVTT